ncbi:50S ribosomal protein L3 [bacterium]|nr:50S ribosomal protein L3 [bacterium]
MRVELMGKKIGMAQLFDAKGNLVGVTVLEVGPCPVLQKKTVDSDGYQAYQLGFGTRKEKHATKPLVGHCRAAGTGPARTIREWRVDAGVPDLKVGDQLTVTQFQRGQFVDVIGTSKGRGFQGVLKRHHFHGGNDSHGSKQFHRRGGAIGTRMTPGWVKKNTPMPGHMGMRRVTTQNLRVIQVRPAENVLLVEGAVPGPNGSLVVVRHAVKHPAPAAKS